MFGSDSLTCAALPCPSLPFWALLYPAPPGLTPTTPCPTPLSPAPPVWAPLASHCPAPPHLTQPSPTQPSPTGPAPPCPPAPPAPPCPTPPRPAPPRPPRPALPERERHCDEADGEKHKGGRQLGAAHRAQMARTRRSTHLQNTSVTISVCVGKTATAQPSPATSPRPVPPHSPPTPPHLSVPRIISTTQPARSTPKTLVSFSLFGSLVPEMNWSLSVPSHGDPAHASTLSLSSSPGSSRVIRVV